MRSFRRQGSRLNCYQILTPDPNIWSQIKSELMECSSTATEYPNHHNYQISNEIKFLIAAQLSLWDISADIYGISGWISTNSGWAMDWHKDGTQSISHVLCLYDTTNLTEHTGGRLAIKDTDNEQWFDIEDGFCILMDQTDPTYLHKVETIHTSIQRKCISVSLKLHTT